MSTSFQRDRLLTMPLCANSVPKPSRTRTTLTASQLRSRRGPDPRAASRRACRLHRGQATSADRAAREARDPPTGRPGAGCGSAVRGLTCANRRPHDLDLPLRRPIPGPRELPRLARGAGRAPRLPVPHGDPRRRWPAAGNRLLPVDRPGAWRDRDREYLVRPELQRTPPATEAIFLLAEHAFDELGYRRLEWKCNALNEPSRRAAIRFGFEFEGVFKNHRVVKGRNRDSAWFAITDARWPAVRAGFEAWLSPDNFDPEGIQRSRLGDLTASERSEL